MIAKPVTGSVDDLWSLAERYGSVGSLGRGADERFEIKLDREKLPAIKADPAFKVESVDEEDES